jgi:hypothetical protein
MSDEIENVLADRGKRYGEYPNHAEISQKLKDVMRGVEGWDRLSYDQKETLDMLAHKMARALNGDPNYDDNWVDIIGYTQLTLNEVRKRAAFL